jgi:hypothetical protein
VWKRRPVCSCKGSKRKLLLLLLDLLLFHNSENPWGAHVALYIGHARAIHLSRRVLTTVLEAGFIPAPVAPIEHHRKLAAKPSRIQLRQAQRNPRGTGRAHEVADDDAQNQAGCGDSHEGWYQKLRRHSWSAIYVLIKSTEGRRFFLGFKAKMDLVKSYPRDR